jgi:hypothetical protein
MYVPFLFLFLHSRERKANHAQGRETKLDIFAYTESENMRPEPFKARFIPRSEGIRRLIIEEAETAREALRPFDGETKVRMEDCISNPAFD